VQVTVIVPPCDSENAAMRTAPAATATSLALPLMPRPPTRQRSLPSAPQRRRRRTYDGAAPFTSGQNPHLNVGKPPHFRPNFGTVEAPDDMARAGGTRVLIADDDADFRTFLLALLESAGYDVTEAATAEEALELAHANQPHLVLLDIDLPALGGYEACRRLRDEYGHDLAIAFLTGTRTESFDRSAGLLLGADDYLVKPFEPDELLARVRALLRRLPAAEPEGQRQFGLTTRELEVLDLLAQGLEQSDIARQLVISPKTVGRHIEHILGKLAVHSRSQALAAAYREGLIDPAPATRRRR
jgi:DNA-binding NarL/FixJ family response regulator